ncbi:MAG TPA: hypothetical protein VFY68_13735 [Nitrososphaeraceae archaeon]|nr:hypothetical protein [Nitrososphaeraceae archaeon]
MGLCDFVSILYEKIFRKRIDDTLNNNNPAIEEPRQEQLAQIKNELEYAYSEGKINDKHYDLLNRIFSNLGSEDDIAPPPPKVP